MAFRAYPDLAFRPLREITQFLHLGMAGRCFIRQRQTLGIEYLNLATEPFKQPTRFECKQAAIGNLAQRPV